MKPDEALKTAISKNFQKVPKKIVNILRKDYYCRTSVDYCVFLKFKNIPELLIDVISENNFACEDYCNWGGFNYPIPKKIHDKIMSFYDSDEFKQYYILNLRKNKLNKLLKK